MRTVVKATLLATALAVVSACVPGGPKVDPLSYQITPADVEKIQIPNVCQASYKTSTPRVAITSFVNNTTYGKMTAQNTNINTKSTKKRVSAGVAGIVATPGAVGVGHVSASKTDTKSNTTVDSFLRQIAPNIGNYAQSAVENTIMNVGGAKVYDRNNLQQIMSEQKFQMTIADPTTAVQLGKLAGVQYVITGSVDNITSKYVEKAKNDSGASGWAGIAASLATAAANTQSGWNINVEMTVKLIDVTTGQVLISKKVKGREIAGSQRNFNPEMNVTAAKKAMGEAVDDLRPSFSQRFAQRGYVQQLRGNKKVALINLGSEKGMEPGTKVEIYDFIEIVDPLTNVATCNMSKIPVKATVSDQVMPNQSWVLLDGKPEVTNRIKAGAIVMREKLKGQSIFKKMF
jgi:hypothetical protein